MEAEYLKNVEEAKKLAEARDNHSSFYWKLNELNERID